MVIYTLVFYSGNSSSYFLMEQTPGEGGQVSPTGYRFGRTFRFQQKCVIGRTKMPCNRTEKVSAAGMLTIMDGHGQRA